MDLSLQYCDREKSRLAIEGLRSYGQLRMSASGVSMLPTILPGDSLLIEKATLKEVATGDIVLYSRGDSLFIHRLIQLDRDGAGFVTRGDSMASPDPAGPKDLLGKVVAIERNGRSHQPLSRLGTAAKWTGSLLCHSNRARSLFLRWQSIGMHAAAAGSPSAIASK